jgi:acylphosphatase
VGFRYWTKRKAAALGLRGWVKNAPDGTVMLEAAGEAGALDVFARALHRGPAFSAVTRVDCTTVQLPAQTEHDFLITY